MPKPRLRSLRLLASSDDPLSEPAELVRRLHRVSAESKYVEWKTTAPVGPTVTNRTKFRVVKAAISFANSEGGFIVFGVSPEGVWKGLSAEELKNVDPAHITDLINSCVSPDIPAVNYGEARFRSKIFGILHIPPSELMPHVTTKGVVDRESSGERVTLLAKHALYCRYGGKSDLATPTEHHRIITRKTEALRQELLRRIKEVPVAVPVTSSDPPASPRERTLLRVARLSNNADAPTVRVTRKAEGANGVLLHEQLADGLFDEINNVLDANALIARSQNRFLLGEPIYYRIYAERQHVDTSGDKCVLLARTGLNDFYTPFIYWCLQLTPRTCAEIMRNAVATIKHPQMLSLMRLAVLLGNASSDWLFEILERRWGNHPQPPEYFWAFKKMRTRSTATDRRLVALRSKDTALIELPAAGVTLTIRQLIQDQATASGFLSKSCIAAFQGSKLDRSAARVLDIITYGSDLISRSDSITKALLKSKSEL